MNQCDFSLILPVLDEEEIIESVVAEIEKALSKAHIDYELVLVENESRDSTWNVISRMANRNPRVRITKTKRGYGSAVLQGLRVARGKYVGYMPSDGQIDVSTLPDLWSEIQSGSFDMVKIRRANRESVVRFIRSKIFNILSRTLFPIDVSDINGSPRIFARKHLDELKLTYKDSFIDTEFAVKAHLLGWKIKEIPMKNFSRAGGESTVRIATVIEFLHNLLVFRFGKRLRQWRMNVQ